MSSERLSEIATQEANLRLADFDEATAWRLGSLLVERGMAGEMPIVINIRTPDATLFHAALAGSSPDTGQLVRRKSNVTLRYHQASLAVALTFRAKGIAVPWAEQGLDSQDFAVNGGSFPMRMTNGRVVAAVTVSGLGSADDHAMVVAALSTLLGQ